MFVVIFSRIINADSTRNPIAFIIEFYFLDNLVTDYNSLPVGNFRALKIESVDATDSAIMEAGFSHFK